MTPEARSSNTLRSLRPGNAVASPTAPSHTAFETSASTPSSTANIAPSDPPPPSRSARADTGSLPPCSDRGSCRSAFAFAGKTTFDSPFFLRLPPKPRCTSLRTPASPPRSAPPRRRLAPRGDASLEWTFWFRKAGEDRGKSRGCASCHALHRAS